MKFYDIFNGDADGLCALHQLRLAEPREAALVTGTKRDVDLLGRVHAQPGDSLTVLDISLDTNRAALDSALARGASVRWFDHHFSGTLPASPLLEAHIDTAPDTCTSLIVDAYLGGAHRAWAVAAAFGDNLHESARAAAAPLGLDAARLDALRELGECLNYNAYGEAVEDLHFHPAELFRRLQGFRDPFAFIAHAPELAVLREGRREDLQRSRACPVERLGGGCVAVVLPDEPWARRASGLLANELARAHPRSAVALLVRRAGGYRVSLRAPASSSIGAHELAREFSTGNGRARAAGIQFLPTEDEPRLRLRLQQAFGKESAG